jgi:hypothetical protein
MSTVRVLLAVVAISSACCGGAPTAPTTQIAGVWTGWTVVTAVSGGECVGDLNQFPIASKNPITVAITQIDSAITAVVTSQTTGVNCSFAGKVDGSTFALSASGCSVAVTGNIQCANGAARDMLFLAQSFSGTASGATLTGTGADSYNITNIFRISVGTLVVNKTFALSR